MCESLDSMIGASARTDEIQGTRPKHTLARPPYSRGPLFNEMDDVTQGNIFRHRLSHIPESVSYDPYTDEVIRAVQG